MLNLEKRKVISSVRVHELLSCLFCLSCLSCLKNGQLNRLKNFLDSFHILADDDPKNPIEIRLGQVKAVFFVKDFIGNREYDERKEFNGSSPMIGKKIQVTFNDGEVLTGRAEIYMPNRKGFMFFPADPKSNTEKVFVVNSSVKEVKFL